MRIVRSLCVAFVAALLSARLAGAQDTREVVLRLYRAGDTVSIRGATVTIDHSIEAGNTDSAGIVLGAKVPVILTSRADSPLARRASCAVASLVAEYRRGMQAKALGAA